MSFVREVLSDQQLAVIEKIFQTEWGSRPLVPFGLIDRPLYQAGIDAQATLYSLVPAFVHRRGSGPHFQADEELSQTVLGAAQSSAGASVVAEFLKVLSYLVDVESNRDCPSPKVSADTNRDSREVC